MKKFLVAFALVLAPVSAHAATVSQTTVRSQVAGMLVLESQNLRQVFNTTCDITFKDDQKVVVATDGNQRFVIDAETFANIRKDSADVEGALDALVVGNKACKVD